MAAKDKSAPVDGGVQNKHHKGKTNSDMKKLGRNLAKVAAQKRGN